MRAVIQGTADMPVIGFVVLSFDSENGDTVFHHQAGGSIVLS
jgi:hypothetical protein